MSMLYVYKPQKDQALRSISGALLLENLCSLAIIYDRGEETASDSVDMEGDEKRSTTAIALSEDTTIKRWKTCSV